jgi:protein-tyrosine phosphatase
LARERNAHDDKSAPEMTYRRPNRVLFVCSGNYYRSRLAEILFNERAKAADLGWQAESRGLLKTGDLKGISEHALHYLRQFKMEHLAGEEPRNPMPIDVEDLTDSDLVIGLCREEHEPMMNQKFLSLAKALGKSGRIRYWHVYDVPGPPKAIVRLLGGGHKGPSQPATSGTDHISLAINSLISELAGRAQV